MIGFVKGFCWDYDATPGSHIITLVTTAGVGFDVQVYDGFPQRDQYELWTHLDLKQGGKGSSGIDVALVGFEHKIERDLYRLLLGVNKVGPKTALKILSLGPECIVSAIVAGNEKALKGVPADARKQLLLFKDKLVGFSKAQGIAVDPDAIAALPSQDLQEEVEAVLAAMAYGSEEIEQAITHLAAQDMLEQDCESYVREALTYLSGL